MSINGQYMSADSEGANLGCVINNMDNGAQFMDMFFENSTEDFLLFDDKHNAASASHAKLPIVDMTSTSPLTPSAVFVNNMSVDNGDQTLDELFLFSDVQFNSGAA